VVIQLLTIYKLVEILPAMFVIILQISFESAELPAAWTTK
jgi:hypothetical protein